MDSRDPLFGSGLSREPVVCALCGTAWDERVVQGAGPTAASTLEDEPELTLCPSCLLTTSHGDPFPDEPGRSETRSPQEA